MQFLTPATLAIAAALTIPPLIALYFLKLKRQVHPISSTLLWRKAIEDLHVNAPFQRLRGSLLLFLQLLILILAALALGQPMLAREQRHEDTLILMIDQSASMAVVEENAQTRLDVAKHEAKRVIDAMDQRSRAMVIAFCDRATMVSSFDTDREALKRKIDTIEQTDSTSTLSEAVTLAEAYSQNLILGGPGEGTDVAPQSAAPPASVILFTDGCIADARTVSPQRLDLSNMEVVRVGRSSANVGIVAMDARRNYEKPEVLQVFATVRNFAETPMAFDAILFINDEHVDVQSVELSPGVVPTEDEDASTEDDAEPPAPPGSVASIAFDEVEYEEGGVVEVRLSIKDALSADNRAWTVIRPPRRVDALLVTPGNHLLEKVLSHLNLRARKMTPGEYENDRDEELLDRNRSKFDVVIFDRHTTGRLPTGNYFFWGSTPTIDGVEELDWIEGDLIIDWQENHAVLRHTNVGSINAYSWKRMKLPTDAVQLIEGESADSNVLSYLTRDGSQYLICAFPLVVIDDEDGSAMLNTDWSLRVDFVTFMYDAMQYLSSSIHTGGLTSLRPGQPRTVSIPSRTDSVTVKRPDGVRDTVPAAGGESITYARTRRVGTYEIDPAAQGEGTLAVNLFNSGESNVTPRDTVVIGSSPISSTAGERLVNEPLWSWLVLGLLGVLIFEWIVYNKRVFV